MTDTNNSTQRYDEYYANIVPVVDEWLALVRQAWAKPDPEGLALYPNVAREDKVISGRDGFEIPVSVFTPEENYEHTLVYYHGGGWIAPTAGKHLAFAKCLASHANAQIISVEYRLSPEYIFPTALHDCVDGYEYVCARTNNEVSVMGDSSGGNLALAVSLYCQDHGIKKPDKILALCPITDLFFEPYPSVLKHGLNNRHSFMGLGAFERFCYTPDYEDWKNPYVSPMLADLSKLPKTLVLAAECDPLFDDNIAFANKIKDSDGDVVLLRCDNMPHTFFTQPRLLPEQATDAIEKMVKFIKS